mgnify:CR=1 FL=1
MMNDVAMAAMEMSSARLEMQYSMGLQKKAMTDMEQQAMGELAMLPPTPGQIWLLPENDDYSPIDGTHAQILGKVSAVVRHY